MKNMMNMVLVWNPGGYFCCGCLRFIRVWAVLVMALAFFTCSVEGLLSHTRSQRFYASTILKSLPSIVEATLKDPLRCGLGVLPKETTATLLVLVSGGCDSTALLHALSIAKDRFIPPLRLHAATFDHRLVTLYVLMYIAVLHYTPLGVYVSDLALVCQILTKSIAG